MLENHLNKICTLYVMLLLPALLAIPSVYAASPDLIVYGDYVLTMEPGAELLRDGAVVIDDDRIIAVGPRQQIDRD